ncbi:NADP-dependent oxidoreductase [Microbacterium betulae]|uniref:NADP-dependent oxidoreductase n=1 Tax=Microbacterium betulae TaxID=2981139 RepID=A0AA97FK46_9MICO|nr:NADP-dependent oxidoreductase [Microbacterium sp. AB]WOF24258.1 NADP-dependent oxidoreductase [Microbacterium sp. AB]
MAKAIQYSQLGGPDVLAVTDVPDPVAGEGQVVIRVEAAGVNPVDAKLRSGVRASGPFTAPRGVGTDGAGFVVSVGEGVDGLRTGDPVVFFETPGAYATDVVASASKAFLRPPGVTAAQGAALGIPVGTAYQSLRSLGVRGDDTLLVHGGSGSVGQAVVQFAALFGARVIATTSDARADRVRGLGAETVPYGEGLADRVREIAPEGPTVVLDAVGTDEALAASLELLHDRRRIATLVQGAKAADLGIRAFAGGSPVPLTAQQLAWRHEAVAVAITLLAAGRFSVELGEALPLAEAARAHRIVESGARGKVVLVP